MDPLTEYIDLQTEKRQLDDRLKEIAARSRQLETAILDDWADRGQTNAKLNGVTLYLATDFYCTKRGGVDVSQLCAALEAAGRPDLVRPDYSASSLKAWIKELYTENDGQIPAELAPLLNVQEAPRLRMRAS